MKLVLNFVILAAVTLHTVTADQEGWFPDCGGSQYPDAGENFPDSGPQIVGGVTPRRHEFPYMVSVRSWPGDGSNHYCGGALIAPQWVVTAAHCVSGRSLGLTRLVFGEHSRAERDRDAPLRQKIDPAMIIAYPLYIQGYSEHDIALIKLEQPVTLSEGVQPVCAPAQGDLHVGDMGIVTGWGDLEWESGQMSNYLQWTEVEIQDNEGCQERFGDMTHITDGKLCAGGLNERERDACQADSGGPLTVKKDGKFSLVGLVSYGYRCAGGYPGVYNRVGHYADWISYTIANN